MDNNQLHYEIQRWLRTLEFIKEENLLLKNRLAEMIHLKTGKHLIRQAEDFQNFFLNNDTIIAMLKNDVHKQERLLTKDILNDEAAAKKAMKGQQILRSDMDKLEKNFSKLNMDFNTFLDDVSANSTLTGK